VQNLRNFSIRKIEKFIYMMFIMLEPLQSTETTLVQSFINCFDHLTTKFDAHRKCDMCDRAPKASVNPVIR
jgi:hypothetical protein